MNGPACGQSVLLAYRDNGTSRPAFPCPACGKSVLLPHRDKGTAQPPFPCRDAGHNLRRFVDLPTPPFRGCDRHCEICRSLKSAAAYTSCIRRKEDRVHGVIE